VRILLSLAACYEKDGRFPKAVNCYMECLAILGNDPLNDSKARMVQDRLHELRQLLPGAN
jgi:hypothetical protein